MDIVSLNQHVLGAPCQRFRVMSLSCRTKWRRASRFWDVWGFCDGVRGDECVSRKKHPKSIGFLQESTNVGWILGVPKFWDPYFTVFYQTLDWTWWGWLESNTQGDSPVDQPNRLEKHPYIRFLFHYHSYVRLDSQSGGSLQLIRIQDPRLFPRFFFSGSFRGLYPQ